MPNNELYVPLWGLITIQDYQRYLSLDKSELKQYIILFQSNLLNVGLLYVNHYLAVTLSAHYPQCRLQLNILENVLYNLTCSRICILRDGCDVTCCSLIFTCDKGECPCRRSAFHIEYVGNSCTGIGDSVTFRV